MSGIEWVAVKKFKPDPIGAIGFIDGKAAMIAAFYDDLDLDQDGKVGVGEWLFGRLGRQGRSIAEVAMQARADPQVLERDPSFHQVGANVFVQYAAGLVLEGIYLAYFSRGVKLIGGGIAASLTSNMIKRFFIRKGFEAAVKKAFRVAVS